VGAGRPAAPPERRGRGQKGAAGVACGACPERGRLGQGLAPRRGWARAMGMAGVGLVMVGLVMEVGWMPWIGAAGPNGHRAACPLSRGGLCPLRGGCSPGRMGWGWARADPGFLGDGSGPAEAQTEDRGWSRFGSAGPDGDSGLVWRGGFEDQPRSTPDLRNPTGLGAPNQADRRTAPPRCCPRQRLRAVRGKAAVAVQGCAHPLRSRNSPD
jgi:hypothetical protein